MTTEIYPATDFIGGGAGALDAIPSATLGALDAAQIMSTSVHVPYTLNATSGAAENSPWIIAPDDVGAGDQRWEMISVNALGFEATVPSGDPKLIFDIGGTDKWYVGVDDDDSDKLKIGEGATVGTDTHITIDGSGNVGIGTTSPDRKLHIMESDASLTPSNVNSILIVEENDHTNIEIMTPADKQGAIIFSDGATKGKIIYDHVGDAIRLLTDGSEQVRIDSSGNVGIGTTAPGQILDCNAGSGNMIADNYDTHSLRKYKENITEIDGVGFIERFKKIPLYSFHRKPFVSAEELKQATLEKFGEYGIIKKAVEGKDALIDANGNIIEKAIKAQEAEYGWKWDVWDELYPDEQSYHRGALWDCPNKKIKDFIDEYAEELRKDRRTEHWSRQQSKFGPIADDPILQETFPEIVSWQQYEDEETPHISGIKMGCYVGMLHGVIKELVGKVENLEQCINLN